MPPILHLNKVKRVCDESLLSNIGAFARKWSGCNLKSCELFQALSLSHGCPMLHVVLINSQMSRNFFKSHVEMAVFIKWMAGCDAVTRHGSLLQSVFVENILGIVGALQVVVHWRKGCGFCLTCSFRQESPVHLFKNKLLAHYWSKYPGNQGTVQGMRSHFSWQCSR